MRRSYRRLARYGAGLTTKGAGLVVALVANIIFARQMGPGDYGVLALALSYVRLPASLVDCGVTASAPRFLASSIGAGRFAEIPVIARHTAIFVAASELTLAVVLLLLSASLSRWTSIPALEDPLWSLALFIPAIAVVRWSGAMLKGLGRNVTKTVIESTLQEPLILAFGVYQWAAYGTPAAVATGIGMAYLCVAVLSAALALSAVLRHRRTVSDVQVRFWQIVRHGLPLNVTGLAARIYRRGDAIIIGFLLGEEAIGLYRPAYMIASSVQQLMQPLNELALFRMSWHVGREDVKQAIGYYKVSVLLNLGIAIPCFIFFYANADFIMTTLFGTAYAGSAELLQILCFAFVAFLGAGPIAALANALGRNWSRMFIVLGVGIFHVGISYVMIANFGLIGAPVALLVSFLVLYIVLVVIGFSRHTGFGFIAQSALLFASMGGAVFVLDRLGASEVWLRLGLGVVGATVFFAIIGLLVTRSMRAYEKA